MLTTLNMAGSTSRFAAICAIATRRRCLRDHGPHILSIGVTTVSDLLWPRQPDHARTIPCVTCQRIRSIDSVSIRVPRHLSFLIIAPPAVRRDIRIAEFWQSMAVLCRFEKTTAQGHKNLSRGHGLWSCARAQRGRPMLARCGAGENTFRSRRALIRGLRHPSRIARWPRYMRLAHDRARGRLVPDFKLISADSHVNEPPAALGSECKGIRRARAESRQRSVRACPKASGCSSTACRRSAYRTIRRGLVVSKEPSASSKSTRKTFRNHSL